MLDQTLAVLRLCAFFLRDYLKLGRYKYAVDLSVPERLSCTLRFSREIFTPIWKFDAQTRPLGRRNWCSHAQHRKLQISPSCHTFLRETHEGSLLAGPVVLLQYRVRCQKLFIAANAWCHKRWIKMPSLQVAGDVHTDMCCIPRTMCERLHSVLRGCNRQHCRGWTALLTGRFSSLVVPHGWNAYSTVVDALVGWVILSVRLYLAYTLCLLPRWRLLT